MISGSLSRRSSRCFSSFSRLTDSLSVVEEYLALEGGPPIFSPGFPSPNLLYGLTGFRLQGFHLLRRGIPSASLFHRPVRFRSPLLTESRLLSFPLGTEMFHFPRFALHPYAFRVKYPCGWVSPFGNPRIAAWLPAPRGLSQVPTSFIASRRQDIRHAPLFGHTNRTPRLASPRRLINHFHYFAMARCFLRTAL
jgi:hypothetical protein